MLSPVWGHSGLILDHQVGYMVCLGWIWTGNVVVSSLSLDWEHSGIIIL